MREDGIIFVSIDDNEVDNLRLLMDEIFGEENFVANVIWQKRTSPDSRLLIGAAHDYILVYSKSSEYVKEALKLLPIDDNTLKDYSNPDNDPRGEWASRDLSGQSGHATASQYYEITTPTGVRYLPPEGRCWAISENTFKSLVNDNRIWFGKNGDSRPRLKLFLNENKGKSSWTWWTNKEVGHSQEATKEFNELMQASDLFNNPKPTRLLKRILQLSTDPYLQDLVLDFFAGSATTAQAVLELNAEDDGNRRFILVQMPEPLEENSEAWKAGYRSIADIGKTRIQKVIERLQTQSVEKAKTPGLFETSENTAGQVLGFQSYRLQYSNFKVWRNDLESKDAILNQLQMFQEPLAEYRGKHSALLTELVLKAGFPLTVDVTQKDVDGCPVFDVDNGRMWVAMDKVTSAVFQAAAEAGPTVFVTLSGLFAGTNPDETMANSNLQLKDAGVEFKVI